MVVSTSRWPIPARISLALADAGFLVAAVSPPRSMVRETTSVTRHYRFRPSAPLRSIVRAIQDWTPNLLICTDDCAILALQAIYTRELKKCGGKQSFLLDLIERSLGSPEGFAICSRKSLFIEFARSKQIRCPATRLVHADNIDEVSSANRYPILVKADGSWGGRFVRLVESSRELHRTILEFQLPAGWPRILRSFLAHLLPLRMFRPVWPRLRQICVQEFIVGPAANRAVVCWKGEVLAGISVKVIEDVYSFGPAAIVEKIEHAEMTRTADVLAKQLELSGFFGFDFVIDASGDAYLVEMNPRVTPIAYLGGPQGVNLSAALFARMGGQKDTTPPALASSGPIPLFPQTLQRPALKGFLLAGYDDVPWHDPKLVLALLHSALKFNIIKRRGAKRRDRQSLTIEKLKSSVKHKSAE